MKTVTMERRLFVVNSANESEFDWLLSQLGITENTEDIDEVEFSVDEKLNIIRDQDC